MLQELSSGAGYGCCCSLHCGRPCSSTLGWAPSCLAPVTLALLPVMLLASWQLHWHRHCFKKHGIKVGVSRCLIDWIPLLASVRAMQLVKAWQVRYDMHGHTYVCLLYMSLMCILGTNIFFHGTADESGIIRNDHAHVCRCHLSIIFLTHIWIMFHPVQAEQDPCIDPSRPGAHTLMTHAQE
jgi:hypothetical protein